MKRLASLGAMLAIVFAIPLSHMAFSDPPKQAKDPGKVTICHLPAGENPGIIIEVSVNAAVAHIEKHGDCYYSGKLDDECFCKIKPEDCGTRCKEDYSRCIGKCSKGDIACQESCSDKFNRCQKTCDSDRNKCEERCSDAAARCQSKCDPDDFKCLSNCKVQHSDCLIGCR